MGDGTGRIVFHVGAQVSSSWLIQKYLRENKRVLLGDGVAFLPADVVARAVGWGTKLVEQPELLSRALDGGLRGADVLVVSHENTVGQAFDEDGRGFYTGAQPALEALARVTEPWDTTIVLTVSPFDSFLENRYLRDVSTGETGTFTDWLAERDLSSLSWRPLYTQLTNVFGQRVRVIDERVLDGGRAAFMDEFFRSAALPMPFTVSEPLQSAGGLSTRALEIMLAANPHLRRARDRAALRRFVGKHFSTLDYPPPELLATDQADELQKQFEADFAQLTGARS